MVTMSKYKYSLIIPHYNIPHLLKRLLDTVPKRDDLQVIIVDDCSTKNTDELSYLKSNYMSVEWYSTGTNGGGGKARNIGLEHARGEYVFFADSDDYFTPGIGDILDNYAFDELTPDIIFFDAQSVNSETYRPSQRTNYLNKYINIYKTDKQRSSLYLKFLFGEPWCKIVKRELIESNGIRFEERKVHNDTYFSYMVGFYASKICVSPIVGYTLTERDISVSTYAFSDKWEIRTEVFAKKNRFLEQNAIPLFDELMLSPFIITYKNDRADLHKLYGIANKYGYSREFILKKVIIRFFKHYFKKFIKPI